MPNYYQMKNRFLPMLIILTLVLAIGVFGFQQLQHKYELSNLVWVALLYYFLLTLILYNIFEGAMPKDNKTFITRFYSATGIRFIFSLFPLLIYLLFWPAPQMAFAVAYVLFYFFYTAFGIYFLMVNLRPDSKK